MIAKYHHKVILIATIDWVSDILDQERPQSDMLTLISLKQAKFVEDFQILIELLLPYFTQELFGYTEGEAPEKVE